MVIIMVKNSVENPIFRPEFNKTTCLFYVDK